MSLTQLSLQSASRSHQARSVDGEFYTTSRLGRAEARVLAANEPNSESEIEAEHSCRARIWGSSPRQRRQLPRQPEVQDSASATGDRHFATVYKRFNNSISQKHCV